MENWKDLKPHALNVYPPMSEDEFTELKKSIRKEYDYRMPIVVFEGEIIDGVNRHRACVETDVIPTLEEFYGDAPEARDYILKTNTRRNLSAGQRAAVVLEMGDVVNKLAEEAAKRSNSNLASNSDSPLGGSQGKTSVKLAQMAGVGKNSIEFTKQVKENDPELYQSIKQGQISAKAAYQQLQDNFIDDDENLRIQRRAKAILQSSINQAIKDSKDDLYDELIRMMQTQSEDQIIHFNLKLTHDN